MISISAPLFDTSGNVFIRAESPRAELRAIDRRLSRTATLDGGAEIFDGGFSHADRTLIVDVEDLSRDDADNLQRMTRVYALLIVSLVEGVFEAAPENFTERENRVTLRLLVKSILS
jgi:hypothetical protein